MQSSHSLSRSSQRPSRAESPSTVGSSNGGSMASQPSGPRSSSGSAQSHVSRSGVPGKQISQIEASVTHLLVATKQLLETLTQWSRQQATENEVSDVYVRLGYEFNLACRAFSAIGVDTSDLGPVPDLLRTILEDTLSQDASPQSLDRYLPRIRDIIINLLHGLKKKQARLRSRQLREDSKGIPPRQASFGSLAGSEAGPSQISDENAPQSPQKRPSSARRYGSSGSLEDQPPVPRDHAGGSFSDREASRRDIQRTLTSPNATSSTLGLPSQLSYSQNDKTAAASYSTPPPPPPPPKQDDALGALQRSGELERRASRRFSAYQIQKHLGTSSNGVPVLPTQTTPIPNRGRDVRESLNAVRLRGSYQHGRQKSANRQEPSPNRTIYQGGSTPNIPEDSEIDRTKQEAVPSSEPSPNNGRDSPLAKTPTDKLRPAVEIDGPEISTAEPSISFPQPAQELPVTEDVEPTKSQTNDTGLATPKAHDKPPITLGTPPQSQPFIPEQSPSPGKELTLFLQYKSKIKKYVIPEGSTGLTIGRLQLAFIEKFAWNTQQNGADLPEIYIQDPISGVRHELEDLSDVKDRSVLVLNVEVLDEVKRHFDDGIGSIRRLIEGVKVAVDGQEAAMQRVSDRQLDTAKEMARLAVTPQVALPATPITAGKPRSPVLNDGSKVAEIQNLRRDIAVLRQTYSDFSSDIAASMTKIRTKANGVKTAADTFATPSFEGDAGRTRINTGKRELGDESERLVGRVDDLQDLVEDLRKDVVSRGVRPLPRQLEAVSKDISTVTKEVKKMQDFLKREKPIWTKIWEKELQLVCEERDQLTMQEDLAADLEDDLEKAAQTFALVEQATRQQNVQSPNGTPVLRSTSRNLAIASDQGVDPIKAKDGVLGEVRALQPNHESRLEAIERAEKNRQKELESRRVGLFQKELGNFVEEGKLKKSGGFEETERLRRAKDERIRREVWERQQARAAGLDQPEKEAAQEASPEGEKEPDESAETPAEETQEDSSSQIENDTAAAETAVLDGSEELVKEEESADPPVI